MRTSHDPLNSFHSLMKKKQLSKLRIQESKQEDAYLLLVNGMCLVRAIESVVWRPPD